jgi:hypothetical protein
MFALKPKPSKNKLILNPCNNPFIFNFINDLYKFKKLFFFFLKYILLKFNIKYSFLINIYINFFILRFILFIEFCKYILFFFRFI